LITGNSGDPFVVIFTGDVFARLVCRGLHHHRRLKKKFDRSAENQSFLVESVSANQAQKAIVIEIASFFALFFGGMGMYFPSALHFAQMSPPMCLISVG
jgi:hypothetical protein